MKEGDLMLKKMVDPTQIGKFLPNWEDPYQIIQKLSHGMYKLE